MKTVVAITSPGCSRWIFSILAISAFAVWSVFLMWQNTSTWYHSSEISFSSQSHSTFSIWDAVAPVALSTDENGFLRLSDKVRTLVIDVGARESDYMYGMEQTLDPTVALIMVDPFPDSAVPLQHRAAAYSMLNISEYYDLNVDKSGQVFMIKAAMGAEEGIQHFNMGIGSPCGSLLEHSNSSSFWCTMSKGKIQVAVLTLEGLLRRIPPFVESFHLKVDAEDADFMVLQGAKDGIRKFHTVIIECTDTDNNQTSYHDSGCSLSVAREYMGSYGFSTEWQVQGGNGNAFFLNRNITMPIPDFLTKAPGITFGGWYQDKAREMDAGAASTSS